MYLLSIILINSNGDKVYLSQGNLQYKASSNTWRFAPNQWDYVGGTTSEGIFWGNVSGSSNNNISPTYSGWIDLFGWGTNGNANSMPYCSEMDPSLYATSVNMLVVVI